MRLVVKLLLAGAFGVSFFWLSSLTVISGDISVASFKGTGSIWLDALFSITPYFCLVGIVFVFAGKFRPIILVLALVLLVATGLWLRFSGVNR